MAHVVVVGGGFAGLSISARLAKLHHSVTLLEASSELGGLLRGVTAGGTRWPLDPESVTLPGVFRDVFRKSGRTLDRALEMIPADGRSHVFTDGTRLDLPFGTRGAQHDAITAALGSDRWSSWLDEWPDPWDAYRRGMLDVIPTRASALARRRAIRPRRSAQHAARSLRDRRLTSLALSELAMAGDDPRITPAIALVSHYVERNFGRWRFVGGHAALADALATRMAERKVDIELGSRVFDVRGTTAITAAGAVAGDILVWCAPTWPTSWPKRSGMPLIPASRSFLTLSGDPGLAAETIVHDKQPLRVFAADQQRWVIEHRAGEDPVRALRRFQIDLQPLIAERHDLSPADVAQLGHRGWAWQGFGSALRRPGVEHKDGVFVAGSGGHAGGSLEHVGMATAAIAATIGPGSRA